MDSAVTSVDSTSNNASHGQPAAHPTTNKFTLVLITIIITAIIIVICFLLVRIRNNSKTQVNPKLNNATTHSTLEASQVEQRLVIASRSNSVTTIFSINTQGKDKRILFTDKSLPFKIFFDHWGPDGQMNPVKKLLYTQVFMPTDPSTSSIYQISLDGSSTYKPLFNFEYYWLHEYGYDISPNGEMIVYIYTNTQSEPIDGEVSNLVVRKTSDGTILKKIALDLLKGYAMYDPIWQSDNSHIVLNATLGSVSETVKAGIYTVNTTDNSITETKSLEPNKPHEPNIWYTFPEDLQKKIKTYGEIDFNESSRTRVSPKSDFIAYHSTDFDSGGGPNYREIRIISYGTLDYIDKSRTIYIPENETEEIAFLGWILE